MEHDGNDVDAAFEALIAREFGQVALAPVTYRSDGHRLIFRQRHPMTPTSWMSCHPWNQRHRPVRRRRWD